MSNPNQHLDTLQDIRRLMERSSKFISLSGLSGIAAGCCALVASWFAYDWIFEYSVNYQGNDYSGPAFQKLKWSLVFLGAATVAAALASAFYFTRRRAAQHKLPLWNHTTRALFGNMLIPLVTGGLLILALLQHNEWQFVAPLCLIFYGLALVNGSKYTVRDIRYLGLLELLLGLISTQFIGYGLYFWAFGFGALHMIYGFAMWWRYEREPLELSV